MNELKRMVWLLVLSVPLVLAGCGDGGEAGGPMAGPAPESGGPPQAFPTVNLVSGRFSYGSRVGQAAPVFAWHGSDGARTTLTDAAGEKPVLVVFWQTTCGYCAQEIPDLNELQARHGRDMTLLTINIRERERTVRGYVDDLGIKYPVLRDAAAEVAMAYDLPGVPTLVVVDRGGKVRYYGHVLADAYKALTPLMRTPA